MALLWQRCCVGDKWFYCVLSVSRFIQLCSMLLSSAVLLLTSLWSLEVHMKPVYLWAPCFLSVSKINLIFLGSSHRNISQRLNLFCSLTGLKHKRTSSTNHAGFSHFNKIKIIIKIRNSPTFTRQTDRQTPKLCPFSVFKVFVSFHTKTADKHRQTASLGKKYVISTFWFYFF